jgi:GTP cyclohydrolase IA
MRDAEREGDMLRLDGDSELVLARSIPFHSLCAHHLRPFYGVAHIGYVPSEKRLRGPEFARIVRACTRGIQVQAEMTTRIGLWLHHQVAPRGAGVLVEGVHTCTTACGISSDVVAGTTTKTTTAFYGSLRGNTGDRREFLMLARRKDR